MDKTAVQAEALQERLQLHLVQLCRVSRASRARQPQLRGPCLRNMAVNCSETRLNISWMDVLLPMKVALILSPVGGMWQMLQAQA